MTEIKPIEPGIAANLMTVLTKDREEGTFLWMIRAYTGLYNIPDFEQISKRDTRYSYGRKEEDVDSEIAIGEFLVKWGEGILAWAAEEGPARERAKIREEAKRKKLKEKEKAKRAKQKKKNEEPEEDEEGEEEDLDSLLDGDEEGEE